jgi:hypothetical protein
MKSISLTLLAATAMTFSTLGFSEVYPSRLIDIGVSSSLKGTLDALARVVAGRFPGSPGPNIDLDSGPQVHGTPRSIIAAKSDAERYTLLAQASTLFLLRPAW